MSEPREGIDFFPLTIDFEERLYARGKIPGSFFRREGRPSTHGILINRLVDRPVRPLFPKGFRNEVQIIITPLSVDQDNLLDVIAVTGASAALGISDIPFDGPIGATRMGYVDGELKVNPTYAEMDKSKLDLVVAGSKEGVIMMEASAHEMPEDLVLQAIERAQEVNMEQVRLQEEMIGSVGKSKVGFKVAEFPEGLENKMSTMLNGRLTSVMDSSADKEDQAVQLDLLKTQLIEELGEVFEAGVVGQAFEDLLEKEFRGRILGGGSRPDGRGLREIRPISCEVGLMSRTHGTGLFSRGETQVLAVATLGSSGDAQKVDSLTPEELKKFMFHYNFPPYSTGEVRRVGSPKRRDIGHGALAERALSPILPGDDEFPYTIRVVSEILSSNGSTSMGSVCAGTLALMDAGVPIKAPVAGISVGLITGDGGQYVTMTDIQGMEDHIGDMDFKVAGSRTGITAIQLDIKVKSIGFDIIRDALDQAKEARLYLLDRMKETISDSRSDLSPYAPRMTRITIPVDKIGAVIGPGGKTIRGIVEETKATVDIEDDGTVIIGSTDAAASRRAVEIIQELTKEIKVGEIYTGKVVKITNFGAFVELTPGKDGMVHISELADYRVPSVEDVVSVGEQIKVIVMDIDPTGRVKLSRRALLEKEANSDDRDSTAQSDKDGGERRGLGEAGRFGSSERQGRDRGDHRSQGGRSGGSRPFGRGPQR